MPLFHQRKFWIIAGVLVALKLWFVSSQPLLAVGWAAHDDRLFLRLAGKILGGEWLGDYNQLTLAKGPAYSLFIASTVVTGVPLPLAQHLLYLLACYLVVRAVRDLLPGDAWALLLFGALWWQPMSFQMTVLGRVLRQNLYTPVTLLVFAGLAALHTRAFAAPRIRALWAALLGFALGVLWLTREESIWIAPACIMLPLAAALSLRTTPKGWARAGWPCAVAATAAALPIVAVCAMNARAYGWFGTVEFRAPAFIAAYGAISRVQAGPSLPLVPVSRAARQALYDVSPAFAELRPYLEGELGENWAKASYHTTHLDASQREIAGGWWMWALRDAVVMAGHAPSAGEALAFYQRLADEVNDLCDRGQSPAGPRRHTLIPAWRPEFSASLWREWPGYFRYFATFDGVDAHTPSSVGDARGLRMFRDLTQWHLSHSDEAPELDTRVSADARRLRVEALHQIERGLRWACIALVGAGLFAWIWRLASAARRLTPPGYLWWFASACLGSAFAIVLINLLVHVTSFSNLSPGAFAQAYPLIVLFAVLAVVDAIDGRRLRATRGPG